MRFHELFEYKRDVTVDTYSDKLKKISSNDPEETLKEIEKGDPSLRKIYVLWIIKQLDNKLIKLEDMSRTHEMLSSYDDLKKHLPIEQRDMNKFTYHELYDIVDNALNADIDSSAKQTLDIEGVDDDEYKLIHNSPLGTLVIPKTENAACVLGKRTSWCTATKTSANYFDDYGKDETLYIWLDKIHNQKYQFHFESVEFKDSKDKDIDWDILKDWRNNHPVLSDMFKEGEKRLGLDGGFYIPQSTILYVQAVIKHQLATDVERKFLRTADIDSIIKYVPYSSTDRIIDNAVIDQIYKFDMSVSSGVRYNEEVRQNERWPELEKIMLNKQAEYNINAIMIDYAENIIKGRWPEFEEALLQYIASPTISSFMMQYAKTIIKGRWPEFEEALLTNNNYYPVIIKYAKMIIKGRWPEGEKTMLKNLELNINTSNRQNMILYDLSIYAKDILGIKLSQWKELMKVLKKHDYELPD